MNEELANLTLGYLIGYYKTHEETIIGKDEVDAINFIIEKNEQLKEVIQTYETLLKTNIEENKQLKEQIRKEKEYLIEKRKPISSCVELSKHFIGKHKTLLVYLTPQFEQEFNSKMYELEKLKNLIKENR